MKIAFGAQLLLDNNKTGIGWCAHNIVEQLKAKYPENEYIMNFFVFGNKKYLKYKDMIEQYSAKGYSIEICRWFHYALYKLLWSFIPIPYHFFMKNDVDVTLFFNFYIPPGVKGKKVTIIHDMAYLAYPETVNKKTLYMLKMNMKKSCKRADKILVVSDFTKRELMKYLGVEKSKIQVMYNGVDTEIFQIYDKGEVEKIKEKYKIPKEYFLYLGTLEPRKNIARMLDAYAMLKKEQPNAPKFVLAGRKGWMYDEIFEKVKTYGLEEDVIFTGYIEQEDAPLLMNGAKAFLFVSLYEGFGMPVLEAMACGTPVITADAASMPEVIGDCGLLADPMSAESIKECMAKIVNDEVDIEDMTKRALKRCEDFTWEKAAKVVREVMESVV